MEMKKLLDLLSDKARDIGVIADWYVFHDCVSLSECYRVAHRTVCDLIDGVRAKCDSAKSVLDLIDQMQYGFWNDYKGLQAEKFERFAELSLVKHRVLGWIAGAILSKTEGATT